MIKLRRYNLEALNKNKHYKLLSRLENEDKTKKYISRRITDWVKEPKTQDKFEVGKTYVLEKDSKYIGLMGTLPERAKDNKIIVELWCTIDPEHRNQGHADKTLGEITLYLIENVKGLEDIRLKIHEDNIYSAMNAKANGYNFIHKELDTNIYQYFKKSDEEETSKKRK